MNSHLGLGRFRLMPIRLSEKIWKNNFNPERALCSFAKRAFKASGLSCEKGRILTSFIPFDTHNRAAITNKEQERAFII